MVMTIDEQPPTAALAEGSVLVWAGEIMVSASERGVRDIHLPRWVEGRDPSSRASGEITITEQGGSAATAHLRQALEELAEYFAGARRDFTVALDPIGATFYQRVWVEVARVPYGETRSYGEIAAIVGAPQASRAVGTANATNPLAPFIPCHRIVGSDGRLTGYGPGLPLKFHLLRMEGALPDGPTTTTPGWSVWPRVLRASRSISVCAARRSTACPPASAPAPPAICLRASSPRRWRRRLAGFAPCPRCQPAEA